MTRMEIISTAVHTNLSDWTRAWHMGENWTEDLTSVEQYICCTMQFTGNNLSRYSTVIHALDLLA